MRRERHSGHAADDLQLVHCGRPLQVTSDRGVLNRRRATICWPAVFLSPAGRRASRRLGTFANANCGFRCRGDAGQFSLTILTTC